MRYTAPYIIAFHLGWDMKDVTDGKYQRTYSPAIYVCGNDYYCAPTERQKLPKEYPWDIVGEYYGRKVYRSK